LAARLDTYPKASLRVRLNAVVHLVDWLDRRLAIAGVST
jgi:hypothetical protein